MAKTFGWIQDAGKLSNLKKVMKELIKLGSLSSVESQKVFGETLNIGRWADETYIRLAEALGFTEYDREYEAMSCISRKRKVWEVLRKLS